MATNIVVMGCTALMDVKSIGTNVSTVMMSTG